MQRTGDTVTTGSPMQDSAGLTHGTLFGAGDKNKVVINSKNNSAACVLRTALLIPVVKQDKITKKDN